MTDFADSTVATTTSYTALLQSLRDRNKAVARQLDGSHTNLPTDAVRWNSAQNRWEKYDGSSWNPLASLYNMNVSQLQGYQTSAGATANTIALRDAAGRIKAAAPSAATDVVRKTELDAHSNADNNPHGVTKAQVGLGSVSNDQQLVRASNLDDLPNKSQARSNLGLGSAATRDTGTSNGNLVLYEDIPQPGNASTSQAGLTEYATTAEHQSGASNRAATPAGVQQMGFLSGSNLWESSEIALDTASRSYAGYCLNPIMLMAWVRCKTAERGYQVGDELPVDLVIDGSNEFGVQVYARGNYIYVLQAFGGIRLFDNQGSPLASVGFTANSANWSLFVRAVKG